SGRSRGARSVPTAVAMSASQQAPSPLFAHERPVTHGDLASYRHHAGAAVDGHALERAVVDVHGVRGCADGAAVAGVVDDEVGVGPDRDRALARVQVEELSGT